MNQGLVSRLLQGVVALAALASIGLAFTVFVDRYEIKSLRDVRDLFASPCERTLEYAVGSFDERFGITEAEFETLIAEAAEVWNGEIGREVFVHEEGGMPINLVYSKEQQASQLGKTIDREQAAYDGLRNEIEGIRDEYQALVARFERDEAAFERDAAAHDEEVAYWNARGGAPPGKYEEIVANGERLKDRERNLNRQSDAINVVVVELNEKVDELNRLAAETNVKVDVYNEAVGEDFDQGNYIEDEEGKRINIFEFSNRTELKRVLAHEFGHALGLEHVEEPDSIMYSYNVGTSFDLTQEDRAALAAVCR